MSRPRKEGTTKVFKQKAGFEGMKYKVYGKKGTGIRTIFPDMDKHPKFANAPWDSNFKVKWSGRSYVARKEARWQENGAQVPVLVWEV